MEKSAWSTAAPPFPLPQPRHYVLGQGLGIRPMNTIRRNLVYLPRVPVGRYSTYEPIPLPLGLKHLNHIPTPKHVNGGKDYHSGCGLNPTEDRKTRQPWTSHHNWVSPTHVRRALRKERNCMEVESMELMDLPESMKNCYNRFARKWQGEGLNVPTILESDEESFVLKPDPLQMEAPLPGYRKSYERFSNNLGWKTKAQVFAKTHDSNSNAPDSHVTQVKGRTPTASKPNANPQQQQQQQQHVQGQAQKQVKQHTSLTSGVLVKEGEKAKHIESHRGQHIRYDEKNIKETYHPIDKDYGHMKIDEPKTPLPVSPPGTWAGPSSASKVNFDEVAQRIEQAKTKKSTDSAPLLGSATSITDMAKDHYRGMGTVLMQSKQINEQIAKDEEEERRRKAMKK